MVMEKVTASSKLPRPRFDPDGSRKIYGSWGGARVSDESGVYPDDNSEIRHQEKRVGTADGARLTGNLGATGQKDLPG